jgi:hypothetical protein
LRAPVNLKSLNTQLSRNPGKREAMARKKGPKATRREEANVLPRKSAFSRLWCYGMWLGVQFAFIFPGQSQFYGLQGALPRDFFPSHKNSTFFLTKNTKIFYFFRRGNPTRLRAGVRWASWQSEELSLVMLHCPFFRVLVEILLFPPFNQSLINYWVIKLMLINVNHLVPFFSWLDSPRKPRHTHSWGSASNSRHTTLGRTPLAEWSDQHTDVYLTTLTRDRHSSTWRDSNP